ncbi:hypothetical protein FPRO04_11529 [Fusarium proliferatum]|nr:hypothetical protein FPRO03_04826 [Fusarium proliferatum]KAG4270370.1 hypothetical protein FPRO04_11529 [Fusarium proliferatum]CVK85473.1 uncharacterized protein FPRN_06650 [Fusarium proliferatum]
MPPSPTQSLHQLSVENSWFATRPLFWTSQHLDLLGVRFLHFDRPIHAPQPRGDAAADLDAVNVIFHVMRLATVPDTESKIKSAIHLLCTPGSPLQLKPKPYVAKFFYAGRPVHQTFCYALHVAKPSPQTQPPIIGCAYYRTFLRERRRRYTPPSHPRKKVNSPVKRLCDSHLRRIIPENWAEDPYIVCLLLSLAQAQAIKQKRAMPETFPVRLLVAFDGDKNFAHVFQADVDARILQALNEPRFDLNGITWPNVTHTKVAFDPYLTFPHRIVAEMLGSYMEHM